MKRPSYITAAIILSFMAWASSPAVMPLSHVFTDRIYWVLWTLTFLWLHTWLRDVIERTSISISPRKEDA